MLIVEELLSLQKHPLYVPAIFYNLTMFLKDDSGIHLQIICSLLNPQKSGF